MPEPLTPQARLLAQTLRSTLEHGSDEDLDTFLGAFAVARIAEHLILLMPPDQRTSFFHTMKKQYPESFPQGDA